MDTAHLQGRSVRATRLFFLLAEDGSGAMLRREFGSDEMLEVNDHVARCRGRVPASQVSLYRHDLVAAGTLWRILQIDDQPFGGRLPTAG